MDYLESLLDTVDSVQLDAGSFLLNIALVFGCILLLGLLGRLIFGKRSGLNHAISSGIGILFLYILGAILYGTSSSLSGLLASLPFVAVKDGSIAIFVFQDAGFQAICAMLVRMILLAFCVNLLDTLMPKGKNFFLWLLFRLITVFLAVIIQGVLVWLAASFLPENILNIAPLILLGILALLLLLGALKLLVGIALTAVNPVIAALYTFFFSSLVGKQLSKSIITTALLCAVVFAMNHFGYVVIALSAVALPALIPVILVLLALWYLVNQIL